MTSSGLPTDTPEQPQDIDVGRDGPVLRITLNRPQVLNAVTHTVLADLADLVEEAGADDDVRVVVLTGAGRAFSSGADLGGTPGPETLLEANRLARAVRDCPKPLVAGVNGPAVGVGCSVALACDLVVAADSAYFLLAFVNIALMPDGGSTLLVPANVGRARAMQMALLGERIPAATALDWGLIHRVVPDDELGSTVDALAARLAAGAPKALALAKRAVNAVTLGQLDGALAHELEGQIGLLRTGDFAEAVTAFGQKRPPRFTGR